MRKTYSEGGFMTKRGLRVSSLVVITILMVLTIAGAALAAKWSDINDGILAGYGLTEADLINISDGFTDGTWGPNLNMTRAQFTKMAVMAFDISTASPPAAATFDDVAVGSTFFAYIEAAKAAGIINGKTNDLFAPDDTITRQQAAAIIARYVAGAKGYDLETYYTEAEIAAIIDSFADASLTTISLRPDLAFAIDMGIIRGGLDGKLHPTRAMLRIEGAAMLTRSLAIAVNPPGGPGEAPAAIELVGDDEKENLIGQPDSYTFLVTDDDGDPVEGALVDFDLLMGEWLVGNIEPAAALTDADGEVTVNVISTEIGIERVSATVPGVTPVYVTKYWVAIDEVYFIGGPDPWAQNNVGVDHEWQARVVVFGPGPLSTSRQDFYNAVHPDADDSPGAVNHPDDGIEYRLNDYEDELYLLENVYHDLYGNGYVPRTMAGIPVEWSMLNIVDDDPDTDEDETVPSVGEFVGGNGTLAGVTDEDGLVSATITSTVTGDTLVIVIADYPENPYPGMMVNRNIYTDGEDYWEIGDWEPQPAEEAWKTWIPHVIGGGDSPIDPAFTEANIGEEFILTITLEDEFGNPVYGRQVEWFMQGIGHFVTDDDNTITDPDNPSGNRDLDVTNAAGQARVMVKSLEPGEQIVHAKVRDKGTGGNEGAFITYDAEVQWFDVDAVTFDDPTTIDDNEALAENPVGTSHDFTLQVFGLKLELDPSIDDPAAQTPIVDTDAPGRSYDGIFDYRDAEYLGGILLVNYDEWGWLDWDNYNYGGNNNGRIDAHERGWDSVLVHGQWITMSLEGGFTQYDFDRDGDLDPFTGTTGIYIPLEGKDVTFANVDSLLGAGFPEGALLVDSVGSLSPTTAVTDENGEAVVTVTSNTKGPQTVEATVDWAGNPHNGPQLARAYAKKLWFAGELPEVNIEVFVDNVLVADNSGEIATVTNPLVIDPEYGVFNSDGEPLNTANIEVHVTDQFGNDLPDYEVVYLIENIGTLLPAGAPGSARTYLPLAYFDDLVQESPFDTNGTAPDSDEPTPAEDPFGVVVGWGGTPAFYFNQWLGAGVPWWTNEWKITYDGQPGLRALAAKPPVGTPFVDIGVATDGAKAWTRDGYFLLREQLEENDLTGSNVDLVLGEDPGVGVGNTQGIGTHYKSIVKVMVYPPADGLSLGAEDDLVFHTQIHKVWEAPVVTTVTLSPVSDVARADGVEAVTFAASVRDQFGQPMQGVTVDLYGTNLEGLLTNTPDGTFPQFSFTTNALGVVNFTWNQSLGDWGVQEIVATADGVDSNTANVQWAYVDGSGGFGDLVFATAGQTRIGVNVGFADWDGLMLQAYLAPGGALLGSQLYDASVTTFIPTPAHTWVDGEDFYVKAVSPDTDGIVNWVYDLAFTAIP